MCARAGVGPLRIWSGDGGCVVPFTRWLCTCAMSRTGLTVSRVRQHGGAYAVCDMRYAIRVEGKARGRVGCENETREGRGSRVGLDIYGEW